MGSVSKSSVLLSFTVSSPVAGLMANTLPTFPDTIVQLWNTVAPSASVARTFPNEVPLAASSETGNACAGVTTGVLSSSATFTVAVSLPRSMLTSASPEVMPVSVTTTVSSGSSRLSSSTGTSITAVVAPARMVTVPDNTV